jgi:hypothetical protein
MSRERILPTVAYGWYYFARSAADNRKIIRTSFERDTFRDLLSATLAVHGMHLHFVHVDENEMHLGVRAGGGSLTKALGSFCEKFAHKINRSRGESGSLFRPHAHVLLVQPGRWFVLLGRFIHWVPRLRGPDSQVNGPQFNSDTYYRDHKPTRGLETSVILRMISSGSRNLHVQDWAYRVIFDQTPSASEVEVFRKGSPRDPRTVGDKDFIARAFRELGVPLHPRARGQPGDPGEIPSVILQMIERFRILCNRQLPPPTAERWIRVSTLDNIRSKSRHPPLPMLRALAASHLAVDGRFRLNQLESFFRCRPRTLSAGRRRAYQRKFEALFNRPYEVVFDGDHEWTSAIEARGAAGTEPPKEAYASGNCRS